MNYQGRNTQPCDCSSHTNNSAKQSGDSTIDNNIKDRANVENETNLDCFIGSEKNKNKIWKIN